MKNIIDYARARYTAKHYDKNKPISAEMREKLRELLRLAPSSVNSQPWHFIIASTAAGKARLLKSTRGANDFNSGKIADAPLTVVFCAQPKLEDNFLNHITEQEDKDGRYPDKEAKAAGDKGRRHFVGLHENGGDVSVWTAKQVYLNIGFFLLGVAALGLDATPIEGYDREILNKEFGLPAKGLDALCMVSVGYRAEDDINASRPKSRLPEAEIIEEI